MRFEERAPHEAGFAETFRQHIAPHLDRLESERWQAIIVMIGIFAVCAAIAVLAFWHDEQQVGGIALAAMLCLPWIALWARTDRERQIMDGVVRHFPGLSCAVSTQTDPQRLDVYARLDLLHARSPNVTTQMNPTLPIEEAFTGSRSGIGIWLAECELVAPGMIPGTTGAPFYGTLIEFTLPPRDDVRYTLQPASGAPAPGGRRLVSLGTEAVRTGLETLGALIGPQPIKYDVSDGVVHAVVTHTMRARPFNVGGITRSVHDCEPMIRATLAQLAQLHAVADALAAACAAPAP